MILTDLLRAKAFETDFVGFVTDVRFLLDELSNDQAMPRARFHGLIISPHSKSSSLGFERSDVRSPRPIAAFERWLHRDSFLVRWPDIAAIEPGRIQLRAGFQRFSARLPASAATPVSWE